MKHKLLYLLPVLLLFIASCAPKTTPAPVPSGTFSGVFTRLHLHSNGVIDTVHANVILTMELATGYAVTGDTSSVHAGSYGGYIIEPNNVLEFTDKTLPPTGVPAKVHLAGTYQYAYDGTNFAVFNIQDTLSFQYILKKTGN